MLRMNRLYYHILFAAGMVVLIGCDSPITTKDVLADANTPTTSNELPQTEVMESDFALLIFSLKLNQRVYEDSDWGDPPQFAIWLEDLAGDRIRTVWVTHRTGTGDWKGKVECPVSLPYWVSRWNKETGSIGPPTFHEPVVDAVTGATPKQELTVQAKVPQSSRWKYFIEVNVSGDFNADFPSRLVNGVPDSQGNGQPSLIYQGRIEAVDGASNVPTLIGRTNQLQSVDYVIADLQGITTAKNLFSRIDAFCRDLRPLKWYRLSQSKSRSVCN